MYLIMEGEVSIYKKDENTAGTESETDEESLILIDKLGAGCTIGSYSMLLNEEFNLIARASTSCTILNLNAQVLEEARGFIEELDFAFFEG